MRRLQNKKCSCLPAYFKRDATELTQNTLDPLEDIMASDKLHFAPGTYMPLYV